MTRSSINDLDAPLSPFATAGATLVENGYSPIPIRPDGKAPGLFARGEWFQLREWSRFCVELPSAGQIKVWERWPAANVGVALGRGVLAFDIDRDDLVEPIRAVLPPCIVAKRGRKGETLFFRGDTDAIKSRGFKVDGLGVMDLISHGKQTVLPPSIHPTSGEPYVWTTERTLLDTRPEELSEITTADLDAVIEVLQSIGYLAEDRQRFGAYPGAENASLDAERSEASEFFRELNEKALANLGAWVPRLGLQILEKRGNGFRSVAEWRPSNSGNPIHKRPLLLGIHPKGIIDYGDGDKTYTAINLVMSALDFPEWQIEKAVVWLGEALGYDFAPKMVLNRGRKNPHFPPSAEARQDAPAEPVKSRRPAPAPSARPTPARAPAPPATVPDDDEDFDTGEGMSEKYFAQILRIAGKPRVAAPLATSRVDPTTGEVFEVAVAAAPEREPVPILPSGLSPEAEMEALTRVPGLVGELVDWTCATSRAPNRTLAFAAALVFLGTIAGRVYKSPSGFRTNLYALGLAPSGFGKDAARKAIDSIATRGGLEEWIAGDDIASGTGMRKRVEQHPAIMWKIDEFGGFMKKIGDPRASHHTKQIRDLLLIYFSSAGSVARGADYAGERAVPCHHPNVGVYGTSTPIDFWGACGSLSVGDGLLARFVIFSVGGKKRPPPRPASADYEEPPAALLAQCRAVARVKSGGNLAQIMDGSRPSKPQVVPYGCGAEDAFELMSAQFADRADEVDREEEPFWSRALESAVKIALILAIGEDPDRPVITVENLRVGRRVAELCIEGTLREIKGRLADNDRQREHIDLRRWIEEAGAAGMTGTQISKRINGRFDARRKDDILKTLVEHEKVVVATLAGGSKGGARSNRFVHVRHLGREAAE